MLTMISILLHSAINNVCTGNSTNNPYTFKYLLICIICINYDELILYRTSFVSLFIDQCKLHCLLMMKTRITNIGGHHSPAWVGPITEWGRQIGMDTTIQVLSKCYQDVRDHWLQVKLMSELPRLVRKSYSNERTGPTGIRWNVVKF